MGSTRLGRRSIARRQALVAIVYSQERSELRPSKRGSARQARSSASCSGVLGIVHRAEHAIAMSVQRPAMGLDEPGEGVLVAAPRGVEQLALGHRAPQPSGRALGCQKAISPPSGVATTLRQPAGPSRGSSSTRGAELAAPGRWPRRRDRPRRRAARPGGASGTRRSRPRRRRRAPARGNGAARIDPLRAPAQQLGVERAGALAVAGVELEVDHRMPARPLSAGPRRRGSDTTRPRGAA